MHRRRRLWWVGALLIALAFLGHDVLMATNAHAAKMATRQHAKHRRADAHHAGAGGGNAAAPEHRPAPPDGSGACDLTRDMVQPAAPDTEPATLAAVIPAHAASETSFAASVRPVWSEPTAPPSTRRALFQAYRI